MTTASINDKKEDEERFLVNIFLIRSEFNRFSTLTKELLHENIQGTDKYHITVAKTYELLQEHEASGLANTQNRYNYRNQDVNNNNNTTDKTPHVSFAQVESGNDETVPGSDGSLLNNISLRYFKCQKKRHLGNHCQNCRSQT